ncbi:MAG: putative virulence factor [Deltaproteobacteria bacterium]|jgi:hypothetical protein|nr:putative virulence factor [Deltaproteobacteria bacterium]
MSPEELRDCALDLREAARNGEKWLTDNEAEQGNQDGVKKRLRKSARLLESYGSAAGKKMGIAVFGPSQVGKSTMISALARGPRAGKLMVDFQGELLDFIKQVNPEGGKETTGLVTRFSLESPPRSPDPALPVCLKLFSEMDIVKILANTYFAEAEGGGDLDEEALKQALERLEKRAGAPLHAPTLDQMEDLNEYIEGISSKYSYGKDLSRYFWPRAVSLAQKLDVKERAELLSFIWGGVQEFTDVYRKLYKALQSLNFPPVAFTEVKALYDKDSPAVDKRDRSVLHVGMLMGLLEETRDTINVASAEGARAALERPVLSALIAELHVKVLESPGDFMIKADILDFPGYRARKEYSNFRAAVKDPANLKECFLRGKVAYVFERYCAQKEITAMLLCIREGNVDCPGLPEVINNWIQDTHGRTPQERTGKPVCLFLVLTFFNYHLIPTEGAADLSATWRNRFDASIGDTFRKDKWPDQWSAEGGAVQSFKNCFWLLNVYKTQDYIVIERTGDPTGSDEGEGWVSRGVRPEKREWIESLKEGYLATENVHRYIASPEEAWKGALESPDGGTGYIISKLTPLVAQDVKTRQLTDLALNEGELVNATLSAFYKGGSSEEEKNVKRQAYMKIASVLTRLGNPGAAGGKAPPNTETWHRFGLLLRDLTLSDDECREIFSRPASLATVEEEQEEDGAGSSSAPGESADEAAESPAVVEEDDIFATFFPKAETQSAAPGSAEAAPRRRDDDMAARYRRLLEKEWKESLERLTADARKRRYYGFPQTEFRNFISELDQGARRLGVMDKVEGRLRDAMGYANINPESRLWKVSRLASAILSEYVCFLGLSPRCRAKEDRTLNFQGRVFTVFEPQRQREGFPELPELSPAYEIPYHNDWRLSFYKIMIDNVDFAEKNYNAAENERMGAILKVIQGRRSRLKPPAH